MLFTLFLAKKQTKYYLFLQLPVKGLFLGQVNYMQLLEKLIFPAPSQV